MAQESDVQSTHADGGIEKSLMREKKQQTSTCLNEQKNTLTTAYWGFDFLNVSFKCATVSSPKEQLWLSVFRMNEIF